MGSSRMKDGPVIGWPSSFEMILSNNDTGLNITEVIYMVSYFIIDFILIITIGY